MEVSRRMSRKKREMKHVRGYVSNKKTIKTVGQSNINGASCPVIYKGIISISLCQYILHDRVLP